MAIRDRTQESRPEIGGNLVAKGDVGITETIAVFRK